MEPNMNNAPQSRVDNEIASMDKFRNKLGAVTLFVASAVGGDLVMSPEAAAQTQTMEQQETWASKFQRMLFKNETALNQELAKMNIPSVRLGEPSRLRAKCGVNFGVYSTSGDHIMDFTCSHVEFEDSNMFMDFARRQIIPNLVGSPSSATPGNRRSAESSVVTTQGATIMGERQLRPASPEELLNAAYFRSEAAQYFNTNELTLAPVRTPKGEVLICVARRQDSQLPKVEIKNFCYNDLTKKALFSYDSNQDVVIVDTEDYDGTKEQGKFRGVYSKSGTLLGFLE